MRVSHKLGDYDGYHSYAVQFDSDGLTLTALMNVPDSELPARGYPILIMNHGNAGKNTINPSVAYRVSSALCDNSR